MFGPAALPLLGTAAMHLAPASNAPIAIFERAVSRFVEIDRQWRASFTVETRTVETQLDAVVFLPDLPPWLTGNAPEAGFAGAYFVRTVTMLQGGRVTENWPLHERKLRKIGPFQSFCLDAS